MKKTLSGIDEFKISWQAYKWQDGDNSDGTWELHEIKGHDEPLIEFFKRNLNYDIIPKYIVNGVEIKSLLNVQIFERASSNSYTGLPNSIYVFHQLNFHLPSLKLILFQLLGGKVNMSTLRSLGFEVDKIQIDWEQIVEEESKDMQLFGCECGDRGCLYFPMEVKKENDLIRWIFSDYNEDFVFDFGLYEKEFKEFYAYLDGYEKFKLNWAEHSKLVTYKEVKDEILFGEYKKYLLSERTVNW